jgi:hypothetical protein
MFESESNVTTDGQSGSLFWNKTPIWGLRPDFYYCQTFAGLLMWGALSNEGTGLSFTIAAGPHQRNHSRVRVPWESRPYFIVSDSILPFSSPPTTRKATVDLFDPPCSVGQFSLWGRFWSKRMEITSFNSRVLASLAVTGLWPVRRRVNGLYLSVVTETFLCALPRNQRLSLQYLASSVVFVVVEKCSNDSPSSNEFTCPSISILCL